MELLISGFLLAGLFFLLTGALGLLRLKDVYSRMHATTKSTTLGVAGMVLAALFSMRALGLSSGLKETLTLLFLFLTAPVGAHMIARTAYRSGIPLWKGGVIDEMKAWQDGTLADPNQPVSPADPVSPVDIDGPQEAPVQSPDSDQMPSEEEVYL